MFNMFNVCAVLEDWHFIASQYVHEHFIDDMMIWYERSEGKKNHGAIKTVLSHFFYSYFVAAAGVFGFVYQYPVYLLHAGKHIKQILHYF